MNLYDNDDKEDRNMMTICNRIRDDFEVMNKSGVENIEARDELGTYEIQGDCDVA